MDVEDLLLTKEEIPLLYKPEFRFPIFQIPIHPALLRSDVVLDPDIAHRNFPQAAEEYLEELRIYTDSLPEEDPEKKWFNQVFLKDGLKIRTEHHNQKFQFWEDMVRVEDNGFAGALSISRDGGGTLYYNKDERSQYISHPRVNFSEEKFAAYLIGEKMDGINGVWALVYGRHNVDHYPGALFLRNWALLTLNESMSQLGEKLFEEDKIDRMKDRS